MPPATNAQIARSSASYSGLSRSAPAVGVANTAAAPASQTRRRIGSERAATSSGSSSRKAKNTDLGLRSTAGTRSHHARSDEMLSSLTAVSSDMKRGYPRRKSSNSSQAQ